MSIDSCCLAVILTLSGRLGNCKRKLSSNRKLLFACLLILITRINWAYINFPKLIAEKQENLLGVLVIDNLN